MIIDSVPTLSTLTVLGAGEAPSFLSNPLIMMVAIIMMMYFLMIRPQQKAKKQQEAKIAAIKKGDKVVTIGGLHSIVHHISEHTVTLKLSEGVFVPYSKTAIQTVTKTAAGKDSSDNKDSDSDSK